MAAVKRDTVAIVDDDEAVRNSLRFLLEATGHKVEVFEHAPALLATDLQHIVCLILDHHMPGMTGLDLAERLRKTGRAIPIMLLTGALSRPLLMRASELGIASVLTKPPSLDDLVRFIDAAKTAS